MSEFPSLPLFTDAFLADTGHLSAQETGAYLLLLMMAWRQPGCCVPDNDQKLARWARVDARTWTRIKPAVMEFWALENGSWTQKRLAKERAFVSKRAEVARENGSRGGRPKPLENKDLNNPAGLPQVTQQKAPNPSPNPTAPPEPTVPSEEEIVIRASDDGWPTDYRDLFWSAFPNKVGKSSAVAKLEAIRKRGDVPWQRLMGGLRSYTAKTDDRPWCNPLTWLNQGRWDDQPAAAPDRQPRAPPSAQISTASLWKSRRLRSESQADEPSDVVPVQFSPGSERGHGPARSTLLEQDRGGTVRQIDDLGARRAFGR